MFKIEPDAFYSRADLAAMLEDSGVDVDLFIARLRTRKVFRCLWRGADILRAYEEATDLQDRASAPKSIKPKNKGNRQPRRKSEEASTELIGGIFRGEEIGL